MLRRQSVLRIYQFKLIFHIFIRYPVSARERDSKGYRRGVVQKTVRHGSKPEFSVIPALFPTCPEAQVGHR